jgi:hypothetical protein
MWKRITDLSYHGLFRVETLKRTMPLWLLIVLALAMEACKQKK